MARSKRIAILPSAKLHGVTMGIAGLIFGVFYSVGGALWELATDDLNAGTALAFFALIAMPALFAAFGLVAGTIGTVLYNFIAERFGGIRIGFEQ